MVWVRAKQEFFYQRQLFSENEYILMAWRYGYVGVIFYLGWIILPWFWVRKMTRDARSIWSKATVIMTPLVLVVAVTNNPMAEPRLMLLYAAIAGMTLAELDNTRKGGVASGMR